MQTVRMKHVHVSFDFSLFFQPLSGLFCFCFQLCLFIIFASLFRIFSSNSHLGFFLPLHSREGSEGSEETSVFVRNSFELLGALRYRRSKDSVSHCLFQRPVRAGLGVGVGERAGRGKGASVSLSKLPSARKRIRLN